MVKVASASVVGKSVADIAVLLGSCKSKSEATRLAKGGGLYWNGSVVVDSKWVPSVEKGDFVGDGTVGVTSHGTYARSQYTLTFSPTTFLLNHQ
ncbi:hypothetical protein LPJ54_002220 [Coemansia sp. RSA 1824]|nr:hypothetical protein LPJ54_002220 [Coemansia sp. RSA 1824]